MIAPKFRAWHKEFKKMYDVCEMHFNGELDMLVLRLDKGSEPCEIEEVWPEEIELMQWAGLQIQNKDLYVGDIVLYQIDTVNGIKKEIGVIEFGEHETSDDYYASNAYGFYIKFVISPFNSTVHSLPRQDLTIIGNIYENIELLK